MQPEEPPRARRQRHVWEFAPQGDKHLVLRLERDSVVPELDQRPSELARPGAELDDGCGAIDEPATTSSG